MEICKLKPSECYFAIFANATQETRILILSPIEHWDAKQELDFTFGSQNLEEVSSLPDYLHAEAIGCHWDMPDKSTPDVVIEMQNLGFVFNEALTSYAEKDEDLSSLDKPEPGEAHEEDCSCCHESDSFIDTSLLPNEAGIYKPAQCYFGIFTDTNGDLYDPGKRVLHIVSRASYDVNQAMGELSNLNFDSTEVPEYIATIELMECTWDAPFNMNDDELKADMEKYGFIHRIELEQL